VDRYLEFMDVQTLNKTQCAMVWAIYLLSRSAWAPDPDRLTPARLVWALGLTMPAVQMTPVSYLLELLHSLSFDVSRDFYARMYNNAHPRHRISDVTQVLWHKVIKLANIDAGIVQEALNSSPCYPWRLPPAERSVIVKHLQNLERAGVAVTKQCPSSRRTFWVSKLIG